MRNRTKNIPKVFLAALLLCVMAAACQRPTTIVTPEGKAAFDADQVLARVEELQGAAIMAFQSGDLDRTTSRRIVAVTVEMAELADVAQQGWQPAVIQAWRTAKERIPALTTGRLGVYVAAIDALLFGGPTS